MGLFKKRIKKEDGKTVQHKGFHNLVIKNVDKETKDAVKVTFEIPSELKSEYIFTPGQYVNINVVIDGIEERRSYSICSGKKEDLSIAIKAVEGGKVSLWANSNLNIGQEMQVSKPEGNFKLEQDHKFIVAFAAGSGITPIVAISKEIEETIGEVKLFYSNKTKQNILFHQEFESFKNTNTKFFLTQENLEGFESGRLTKEVISELIKTDLNLLKADAYFLCGPEDLIANTTEILKLFGVAKNKIHFELYTTPVSLPSETTPIATEFKGKSNVTILLDDEKFSFELDAKGKSILETVTNKGYDAPYSCRGGVCCTCKAKVLEGKASMKLNYSLTDEEVAEGYILTCQAYPASENLLISYDE